VDLHAGLDRRVHAVERYDPRPKWLFNAKKEQPMASGIDFDVFTGR
jgi:hypothetical protein